MAAGERKADAIQPEKEKDDKKHGEDQKVDAAVKLLNDSQSKPSESQVQAALMAKLSGKDADLLGSTVKQDYIVKTGNDYADFGLNLGTGVVRNLADFGKTIAKSVKDPLSVIHDVGAVGAAVVENPNAIKKVVDDGISTLKFEKGAAEAGNAYGNLLATIGTLYGGGRGALTKVENKAVAGAGSIEQKIVQTNKLLSSVETNAARMETAAARFETAAMGPAPKLGDLGLKPGLTTRLDGLATRTELGGLKLGESTVAKVESGTVKLGESAAAKVESGTVGSAPKLDAKAAKLNEPVLREPVAKEVPPIKEPIQPKAIKEGPAPTQSVADDAAKLKKPANATVADDAAKLKAEPKPANANVADDAAKLKAEPKPANATVADDAAKLKAETKPANATVADDAAKLKAETKPANANVADDAAKLKAETKPANANVADDAAKLKAEPAAKPANTIADDVAKPKPLENAKVHTTEASVVDDAAKPLKTPVEPGKPATFSDNVSQPRVKPTEPAVKPGEPTVKPGEPTVRPGEPTVRPDATDFRPNNVNRPIVERPIVERPIVSEPLPKIDGGGLTVDDRLKINKLSDHLDRMPANTPGLNDVKTNLTNFKTEPSPENYRKIADSIRTLERTGGDNLVVLKEKAEVALEVARQTTLMHSVNYTTQSIERLVQTSQAQIALLPGGSELHSKAMDLVSRLQGSARAMVTAETAHAEIAAFSKLRGETQQLQQMLSQVKGAQSAIENSIKQLEHAQQSLNAANRLVRTGDTLKGQIADMAAQFFSHPAARITNGAIFLIQADIVLGKFADSVRAEAKAEAQAEIEKLEKAEQSQATQKATEEQKQASLYLNSKEIQQHQKHDHDNDIHERTRRSNLNYGVTIDDYVYYQKAPGAVAPQEEIRQTVHQNFVRPFRSNVEQQDKTAVQKFDWKKTRFNADGSTARSDNPYLSSPIVAFRPASKAVSKAGASTNDPNHANALIAKNYAFAVGPQQQNQSRSAVPAMAVAEAAEKANPDRSSGAANPSSGVGNSAAILAASALKNDPASPTATT